MKIEKKRAVESTENVKELALKIKGREIKQNSQSDPLKPCRDRAQKALRTAPLNSNMVISSQRGVPTQRTRAISLATS